ncbi:family 2 glycosyl transferase, partial [Streptomyces griseus]|nr:family 2 glycosyl transferase [Streptomyces griseus]
EAGKPGEPGTPERPGGPGDDGHPDDRDPAHAPDPAAAPGEYIPAQQSADPYAAHPPAHDPQEATGGYAAVPRQQYGEYAQWDGGQQQGADYYATYQPDPYAQQQQQQQQQQGAGYQGYETQAPYPQQYGDPGAYNDQGAYAGQAPYADQAPYTDRGAYDEYGQYVGGPYQQQPYTDPAQQSRPDRHPAENGEQTDPPAPGQAPWQTGNASRGDSE